MEDTEKSSTSSSTKLDPVTKEATTSSIEEGTSSLIDSQFRQPTPAVKKEEERKFFECADCGLNEEYYYFGKHPPFCRTVRFLEDSYLVPDPFSARTGNNADFLLLGANCTVCSKMTCQDCSVFFAKRFCAQCYKLCSAQLPEELIKSKKKSKD